MDLGLLKGKHTMFYMKTDSGMQWNLANGKKLKEMKRREAIPNERWVKITEEQYKKMKKPLRHTNDIYLNVLSKTCQNRNVIVLSTNPYSLT